ncbi:MAG: 30S ribosomal protein S6 [Candidatus Komeilibacteria bacterium]
MEKKHYELTYIVSTAIAETEHPAIKQSVADNLTQAGATITDQQDLGKKKFTYVIDKVRHGFYQVIEFDTEPATINTINQNLKLNSNVLRFLIVIKNPISAAAQERQAKIQKAHEERAEEKENNDKSKKTSETKKPKQKVSLEDLDEKLDQILDSDDLIN